MSGPWERYQTAPAEAAAPAADAGPWQQYAAPPAAPVAASTPNAPTPAPAERRSSYFDAATRGAGQGISMGWGDELSGLAAVNNAASPMDLVGGLVRLGAERAAPSIFGRSGTERYNRAVEESRAANRAAQEQFPWTYLGGQVAGGIGSGAALPGVNVVRGASLLHRAANGMATGAAYGALTGVGEADNASQIPGNVARGVGIGAGVGLAAPVAATGLANIYGRVAERVTVPEILRPFERGAVERVGRAIRDDRLGAAAVRRAQSELGPEGILADMGSNVQRQAAGLVASPGPAQSIIVDAVRSRAAGAPARITDDLNATLGPPRNVPETLHAIRQGAAARSGPLYEQFRAGPVPFTRDLEATLGVLRNEPSVLREARRLANLDDPDAARQFFANIDDAGRVTINRVPNATELDYLKRGLDDLARSPVANDRRIYGELARRVRQNVDDALVGTPNEGVYAQARGIAGEAFGLRNSLEEGRAAFSRGLSPDQMSADMAARSMAERAAYNVGARQNIRDLMGNAATKWGENPDTAARAALGSQYAREKLGILVPNGAERLTRRLEAETAFDRTAQAVRGNSETAARAQASAEFPGQVRGPFNQSQVGNASLFGTMARGVTALANMATGGAINDRNARIATDAAKMLVAQGAPRDAILQGLLTRMERSGTTEAARRKIEGIARILLESPRTALIDQTSP